MDNLYDLLEIKYGLPPGTLNAVKKVESGGNPNAVSPKGAKGSFQFMPKTAEAYDVNVKDDVSSAMGAARYLSDLKNQYNGNLDAALAHYNGGHMAGQAVASGKPAPFRETRNYIEKVKSNLPKPDLNKVVWDDQSSEQPIDVSKVQWDEPAKEAPKPSPALAKTEESGVEQFFGGLKKSVTDLGYGAKQLLDIPAQAIEKIPQVAALGKALNMPTAAESAQATNKAVEENRLANQDIMNSGLGMTGYAAGTLASSLLGGGALRAAGAAAKAPEIMAAGEALMNPATYKAAATIGAVQGALQPTIEGESKLFNTMAGGALGTAGQGVVNVFGRIAQPVKNQLTEIGNNAVKVLKDAGVPLDAAQTTGSALLTRVKAALNDNPFTASAENVFTSAQKSAYNKAVAKTMGETASSITPEVIQNAKNNIGKIYDDVASKVNIKVDDKFLTGLSAIDDEAKHILNDSQYSILSKNVNNILTKASENGGQLNSSQYQNVKKTLDKLSGSSDTDVASYARELRDLMNKGLSDSAEAAGQTDLVDKLKLANKQWGNMRKIENVVDFSTGDVSPSLLYNHLKTKSNRNAFYAEDSKLADLAAAGKAILPSKTPNSGTVARLAAQAAPAAVGSGLYGLYEGDLGGAAKGAAIGYALPKVAQSMINNPAAARYMAEGLPRGPIRNLLELPRQIGVQKYPQAGFNAYLQSLPPEQK